jgi:hypothetical protein
VIDLLTLQVLKTKLRQELNMYHDDLVFKLMGIVMNVLDEPEFHVVLNCSTNEDVHET